MTSIVIDTESTKESAVMSQFHPDLAPLPNTVIPLVCQFITLMAVVLCRQTYLARQIIEVCHYVGYVIYFFLVWDYLN